MRLINDEPGVRRALRDGVTQGPEPCCVRCERTLSAGEDTLCYICAAGLERDFQDFLGELSGREIDWLDRMIEGRSLHDLSGGA